VKATVFTPAVIAIAALAAQPVQAQFMGIGKKKSDSSATTQQCQQSEKRRDRSHVISSLKASVIPAGAERSEA